MSQSPACERLLVVRKSRRLPMKLFFSATSVSPWCSPLSRLRPAAVWLGKACLGLLFPPRCACCDAELDSDDGRPLLCADCCRQFGPEVFSGCRRCGASIAEGSTTGADCPHCRGVRLHFDGVIPLGAYQGKLREAVLRMKRLSHEPLSVAVGKFLAARRAVDLTQFKPDVIVPIPMHWRRRLGRGINNPEILAECLARHLRVSVARRTLVRCRHTQPQKDLLPKERFRNVRGAFRIRRKDLRRWQGSHVLLVDDILTTGATCSEAASVLKEAGVKAVAVAVVAKAQRGM
jgi:ComF family protein